jgi:hypothetical protein
MCAKPRKHWDERRCIDRGDITMHSNPYAV